MGEVRGEVRVEVPEHTEQLEALVIETVQIAAERVFSTMLNKRLIGKEIHQEAADLPSGWGVSAQISLVGACSITGLMNCSPGTACRIASAMLMEECLTVDGEVLDAMAEIANMIMGNVKTDLDTQLGQTILSIPTVISGQDFLVYNNSKRWTVVPFVVDDAPFIVKLCFEAPAKKRALHAARG
jgi:chemotaxis protein CheX